VANTGLGSQAGFKKESVWGTAVTVDKFYRVRIGDVLSLDQNYYDGSASRRPNVRAARTTKVTTRTAGGDVTGHVP
jgi:hypothetical protein